MAPDVERHVRDSFFAGVEHVNGDRNVVEA